MSEPQAFNVKEAARRLSLSRATVYRLIERGELKSRKALGRRIISKEALDDFLRAPASGAA